MTNQETALTTPAETELEVMKTQASLLAQSQFLPKHYAGKPADCLVAIQWAKRTGLDPLELLQNTFVVHGTPGMKATYMIAQANMRGPFAGPIRFDIKGSGADLAVTAWGMIEGERYETTVTMAMAKKAGWAKNPKYQEIPEQILCYRAATFLIRLYCPEVLCGMPTADEVEDVRYADSKAAQGDAGATTLEAIMSPEPKPEPAPEQDEAEDADFTPVDETPSDIDPEDIALFSDMVEKPGDPG